MSLLLQGLLFFLKKKKHKLKKKCPLLKEVLLLMPEGEGRHYPKKKIMINLRHLWSPLLWPIGCWFWPTRLSLDLSLAAASLTEGRSCLMPPLYSLYLSPLHKGGPYTAKLLGSFSKSFSPIAVTHLVKAKPLGLPWCSGVTRIMDFQQEAQPLLQTENVSVNKLVFHFVFEIISEY